MKSLELRVVDRPFVETELENGANWDMFAACQDNPGPFSPVYHESKTERGMRIGTAKAICRSCLVRQECYDDALENFDPEDKNIRAGLEAREIKILHKKQSY